MRRPEWLSNEGATNAMNGEISKASSCPSMLETRLHGSGVVEVVRFGLSLGKVAFMCLARALDRRSSK